MIRDRIVMGICDKAVQERLLRESDLTLEKAINFCRATEASKTQSKMIQGETAVNDDTTKSLDKVIKIDDYQLLPAKKQHLSVLSNKIQAEI